MSRKRRRDVSPERERGRQRLASSQGLSLSQKISYLIDDASKSRHSALFDKASVRPFVNRLALDRALQSPDKRVGLRNRQAAPRDRRFWHPKKDFLGATLSGREATVFGAKQLEHYAKDSAMECHRRRERREVLFARGHGGKGHRVPHRLTEYSKRTCS